MTGPQATCASWRYTTANKDLATYTPSAQQRIRSASALVERKHGAQGGERVNPMRAYRELAQAGLLLPNAPGRLHSSKGHWGKVAVGRADRAGAPTDFRSIAIVGRR